MDGALIATQFSGQITVRDVTIPDVEDLIEDEPAEIGYHSAQADAVDERHKRMAVAGEAALAAIVEQPVESADEPEPLEQPTMEDIGELFQ